MPRTSNFGIMCAKNEGFHFTLAIYAKKKLPMILKHCVSCRLMVQVWAYIASRLEDIQTCIFYGEEDNAILVRRRINVVLTGNYSVGERLETVTVMLGRNLLSVNLPSLRGFSSAAAGFLRSGDTLKQNRVFTNEDVLEYSKVSHDSNPLHLDSEAARNAGFEDQLVHGMLVAALFPKIISSHFVSMMLHNFILPSHDLLIWFICNIQ